MTKLNGLRIIPAVLYLCLATTITTSAQGFKTLVKFDGTDGGCPNGGLVQGRDGSLYGATYCNGADGEGTVFRMTPRGVITTLYSFCSQSGCPDGYGAACGTGPRHRRNLLWNDDPNRECWHNLQDQREGRAYDYLSILLREELPRWLHSLCGTRPRYRWESLRGNRVWGSARGSLQF